MKFSPRLLPWLVFVLGGLLAGPLRADEPNDAAGVRRRLTEAQLDELLGPIALYPDALVAVILPAATTPTEVVLAARFLGTGVDPALIDAQPWSESVKALARYPEVVKWMDENLQWTEQVGDAFLAQPADMMNSIQRLRARARAAGALVDTPQQRVVLDGDLIEIDPAQPELIYVPRYDPDVVYLSQSPGYFYPYGPYLTFGIGFPIGRWLSNDFDWRRRVIWVGDRQHDWREHRDGRRPLTPGRPVDPRESDWHPWQPPANRPPTPPRDYRRASPDVVRPQPLPGTPVYPHPPRRDEGRPPSQTDTGNRPPGVENGDRPPRMDRETRPPRTDNSNPRSRPDENSRPPRREEDNPPPRNPPDRPAAVPEQSRPPAANPPRREEPANRPPPAQPPAYRPPPPANPPPAQRNPNPPPPAAKDRDSTTQDKEK